MKMFAVLPDNLAIGDTPHGGVLIYPTVDTDYKTTLPNRRWYAVEVLELHGGQHARVRVLEILQPVPPEYVKRSSMPIRVHKMYLLPHDRLSVSKGELVQQITGILSDTDKAVAVLGEDHTGLKYDSVGVNVGLDFAAYNTLKALAERFGYTTSRALSILLLKGQS